MDSGSVYGRGISFPPRVGPDGRIAWSEGLQNIRECIQIVLLTEQRERLNLRDFGGGLGQLLFEPNTITTHQLIRERIARALARWEPRIVVEDVAVELDPDDPEAALVTILYRLVATQAREQTSLSVPLSR
jgi:uncharacterized protein